MFCQSLAWALFDIIPKRNYIKWCCFQSFNPLPSPELGEINSLTKPYLGECGRPVRPLGALFLRLCVLLGQLSHLLFQVLTIGVIISMR